MDTQEDQQKGFVCQSCGSKSQGEAGTCCGAPRAADTSSDANASGTCLACSCPCDMHKEHNHA